LVAVVEQYVHASGFQLRVDGFGHLRRLFFHDAEWTKNDRVWRDGQWPDQAVLVVFGFRKTGDDAVHADAVAPHDDRLPVGVFVVKRGIECDRILRAQLEDVADFDTVDEFQRPVTAR
jgi:hypothetical protein